MNMINIPYKTGGGTYKKPIQLFPAKTWCPLLQRRSQWQFVANLPLAL